MAAQLEECRHYLVKLAEYSRKAMAAQLEECRHHQVKLAEYSR